GGPRPWRPWTRRRARARRRARRPRAPPPCARPRCRPSGAESSPLAASLPPARVPRLRSRRRGLRPAEQHEVVAVDHLVAALVAEETLDVARLRALDLLELRRAVVDATARELAPVG